MDADNAFADFIHSNPEFNIKRWLKTRNHVDEKLITRTPKKEDFHQMHEYMLEMFTISILI